MATISKTYRAHSAHQLPLHKGKCANEHGHTYHIDVFYSGEIHFSNTANPSATGMLVDYDDLDQLIEPIIAKLDHHNLNDLLPTPTAEMLGIWILKQLEEHELQFHSGYNSLYSPWRIVVHETESTSAEIRRIDLDRWYNWNRQQLDHHPDTGVLISSFSDDDGAGDRDTIPGHGDH